jgi:glyoxylase I family protein
MKIEHFALNVEDPVAMRRWYTEYLGLSIVKSLDEAPYTTFMADSSGTVMLEIYCNPKDQVPDYRSMNPLLVHIAFISEDPASDKEQLTGAGATIESDQLFADNSHLVMLRDPWGLAIQLCKRGKAMVKAV